MVSTSKSYFFLKNIGGFEVSALFFGHAFVLMGAYLKLKLQMYIHVHVGTVWRLKGHNPGLKGFRCVQLHNVWWQQIPIPHCSWEK